MAAWRNAYNSDMWPSRISWHHKHRCMAAYSCMNDDAFGTNVDDMVRCDCMGPVLRMRHTALHVAPPTIPTRCDVEHLFLHCTIFYPRYRHHAYHTTHAHTTPPYYPTLPPATHCPLPRTPQRATTHHTHHTHHTYHTHTTTLVPPAQPTRPAALHRALPTPCLPCPHRSSPTAPTAPHTYLLGCAPTTWC